MPSLRKTLSNPVVLLVGAGIIALIIYYLYKKPVSTTSAVQRTYAEPTSDVMDAFGRIGPVKAQKQNLRPIIQENEEEITLPDYLNTGKPQIIRVHRTLRRS